MTCFPRLLAGLGVREQREHTPRWQDSRTLTALLVVS